MTFGSEMSEIVVLGGSAAAGVATYMFVAPQLARAIPLPVSPQIKMLAISGGAALVAYMILSGMEKKQ